ncbi:MAG: hypothetical protein AB7F99_05215 [Vicinamibacterales bacterium]
MLTRPAVIGGLVIGVLSALPLFAAANICCCLWVVTGGLVASYLLQQDRAEPIALTDGALVGLLAGLVGSGVYLVLSIPITMAIAPFQREFAEQLINSGTLPPEFRDYFADAIGGSLGIAISFFFMLISGIIFATLGGLLGAAIFRKPQTPVASDVSGPM